MKSKQKLLFLDRDGTLIRNFPYNCNENLVHIEEGSPRTLKKAMQRGYRLIIVSNQSSIGRGLCTISQVEKVNARMSAIFRDYGVIFDRILYCPHAPYDSCSCRKPKVGLIQELLTNEFGMAAKIVVGDQESDMLFGKAIGAKCIRYGTQFLNEKEEKFYSTCATWEEIGSHLE